MPSDRPAVRACGPRRAGQSGVSIIELIVGLVVGLLLVAAMLQGFASSSSNANTNSLVSEYQTNGRYALEILKREIRHAALHPLVWDPVQVTTTATATSRDYGCGSGVSTNLMQGIVASNDASLFPSTCFSADRTDRTYARGDMLMLRRADRDAVTAYVAGAPYVRVSYGAGNVFVGGTDTPSSAMAAPVYDYALRSDVYFVNDFTTSATESPKVPALYRLTLGSGTNPTMTPELVASNVEHLQLQFGQITDAVAGSVRYVNADAVTDWSAVTTVRIWLLLRSTQTEPGLTNAAYRMGDVVYNPADSYRRTVLSSTIDLRNQ